MHNPIRTSPSRPLASLRALRGAISALFFVTSLTGALAQGSGYWHTSGNKILDSNGEEVRMAGINWYGFETPDYLAHGLWAQDYKSILNTIKAQGFNFVRIPFSNQLVESNPIPTNFTKSAGGQAANQALVGQHALTDLDTIVAYAGSIGLRIVLDNHVSEAGGNNEASGLWYTSAYPQANWLADWQTMATRYSDPKFTFNGNPTVIGVDLRNEPHSDTSGGSCWTGDTAAPGGCPASLTAHNWPVAATAAGNAVLAINPKLLVFVEGVDCYSGVCGWEGGNLLGVASNPVVLNTPNQLVYSAHDYGPNLYQQGWFNGSTTQASLNAVWNKYWGYISAENIAPVWLGEFGTTNNASDLESNVNGSQGQWFQSMIAYLQNNPQIHWSNWSLNGEDNYALLDSNYDPTPVSSLKESLLSSVQFPLGETASPSFTLTPAASAVSLVQGGGGSDSVAVEAANGFTGNVTLSASGLPGGVTASFGSNPTSGSSVVTFAASAAAVPGTYTVSVRGTAGALSASTSIALTVAAAKTPSFTLAASTASLTLAAGASATDTVSVTAANGFSGNVSLAVSGLPSGVTAAFGTNPATGSSVLTFTAAATAVAGTSSVTVTGTSGALSATTTIALTVPAACTPTAISPFLQVNGAAWQAAATVSVASGAVVNLGPQPLGGTWSWTGPAGFTSKARELDGIALAAGNNSYVATYTNAAGCRSTQAFAISVAPATPGFTLSASSPSLSAAQGATATGTVTVVPVNGFAGSVALAASGLPAGVTAAFSANPATGSSAVTFTAASTALTGTYNVAIAGTSGSLTASTSIALTVTAAGGATGGFACHVGYSITSQWQGGFAGALTIQNTGSVALTNWSLSWTFANGQTVTQIWNGKETQTGATVTVANVGYNGSILAGGSLTTVGFNGTWNNSANGVPTSFTINGTACR